MRIPLGLKNDIVAQWSFELLGILSGNQCSPRFITEKYGDVRHDINLLLILKRDIIFNTCHCIGCF